MSELGCGSGVARHFEAAADPIVAIAAFRHPGTDKLAQHALERIANLRMLSGSCSERAAMAPDNVEPVLLIHLRETTEIIQERACSVDPIS